MSVTDVKINKVCDVLKITPQLAKELLLLAGGDVDLVIQCSQMSNGLDHCKANITNKRFSKLEKGVSDVKRKGDGDTKGISPKFIEAKLDKRNEAKRFRAENCFRANTGLQECQVQDGGQA